MRNIFLGSAAENNSSTQTCVLDSLQLLSLSLIVAEEVSILTGVHVFVNLQQEPLAELKRLRKGTLLNKNNQT